MSDRDIVMCAFDEYIEASAVNITDDSCEDKEYWYIVSRVLREMRDVITERLDRKS